MKPLSENRRARFDYDILEHFEAGIELTGQEVKSVKGGHGNLAGAYAIIRPANKNLRTKTESPSIASAKEGTEVLLLNCQIPPYQPNNVADGYNPSRTRRLLLRKDEIKELAGKLKDKGLSLLALSFYTKKNLVKVDLGLGRSRKTHDKRDLLKKRAVEREMDRRE